MENVFAPILPLMDDPEVNDILINGPRQVYVERAGRLEPVPITFSDEAEVRALAEAIAAHVGLVLDPAHPQLDARLEDGSRVHIVCPPVSVDGTNISIRKFAMKPLTLDRMADKGSVSPQVAELLKICARSRLNIVISGGTGSGKTTLLNALSQYIDEEERVITIEDAAELRLQKRHVVRMETRPALHGEPEVTTRELVRGSLRMRPDRIIVGEVRGAEAFDMMQAMNTGHEGSLTTIHANHPRDALFRLENMISMAGLNQPLRAVRGQMATALHLVIQVSRMHDGVRRVTFISEIGGMEGDVITMQDLIAFQPTGETASRQITGEWKYTGLVPRSLRRMAYWGEKERFAALFGVKLG